MRKQQLEFKLKKTKQAFGGSLLKGNPKTRRPLSSKLPVLITLRATTSLLRKPFTHQKVNDLTYQVARKYGVRIYEFANVGNHLHVLARITKLTLWPAFIRELTGKMAWLIKKITGAMGALWMFRPHTRIVGGWRKAFTIARDYVHLNVLEAEGWINRRETKTLKDLRVLLE